MTNDDRAKLITRNLEELLTKQELDHLIESGTPLKHYIGFEISGKLHIGHFFQLMKVKDMQDAGAETIIWLADMHSAINDKLDGNLETIKRVGREYFMEAMKVLFTCIGGNPEKLIFKFCSEEYATNGNFWLTFLEMGKGTNLARTLRSITIMGREQTQDLDTAKLMYPIMQASDIFLLQTNIAQAGIEQRKVHVVARESALRIKTFPLKDIKGNQIKPVALHTPILLGLTTRVESTTGERDEVAMRTKMSKSKADSAVSVHDATEDIIKKINQAYAPEGEGDALSNPLLNWVRYLVFYAQTETLTIKRAPQFGGDIVYESYDHLEKDYKSKKLHPMDLKGALAEWLITTLEPIRRSFEDPKLKEGLIEVEALSQK